MIRHFCLRLGPWMLQNWHLYRLRHTGSANGKAHWIEWRCVCHNRRLK
jgi:hypothetical protein